MGRTVGPYTWYLEGFLGKGRRMMRTAVATLPFGVGRRSSSDLALSSKMVSQRHAEIFVRDSALWLRDLGSTNGTFVNGDRVISENILEDGDIIHFADLEFRLVRGGVEDHSAHSLTQTVSIKEADLPGGGVAKYRELREMLRVKAVRADFQPLVRMNDGDLLGYEVLGRGNLTGVPSSPGELFFIAEVIGLETELSVAFRNHGVEESLKLPVETRIFVNTHPTELSDQRRLLDSLRPLRKRYPDLELVLEIHESAVTDVSNLRELRAELDDLRIEVAFDDFGVGQARLVELSEAAPHYLKFDAILLRNLHRATKQRRDLVKSLLTMVLDLGIVAIGEGIECQEEAEACIELGFEYAQGYLYGRPAAAANWADVES